MVRLGFVCRSQQLLFERTLFVISFLHMTHPVLPHTLFPHSLVDFISPLPFRPFVCPRQWCSGSDNSFGDLFAVFMLAEKEHCGLSGARMVDATSEVIRPVARFFTVQKETT
jgi:hypothetical protein